jgi:putative Ca2+/H+ antiporter (TMEM165/GDT1 family)
MTGWKLFLSSWSFEPTVMIGCAVLAAIYLFAVRGRISRQSVNFLLGVLVIFLALVSPVDRIG